jgi:hypothetical protein
MMSFIISFLSYILVFNFVFFYLDDFKLSQNRYIRFSQILSPLLLVLFIILFYYEAILIVFYLRKPKSEYIYRR